MSVELVCCVGDVTSAFICESMFLLLIVAVGFVKPRDASVTCTRWLNCRCEVANLDCVNMALDELCAPCQRDMATLSSAKNYKQDKTVTGITCFVICFKTSFHFSISIQNHQSQYQDIVCQKLWRQVKAALSYRRKPSRHFWDTR